MRFRYHVRHIHSRLGNCDGAIKIDVWLHLEGGKWYNYLGETTYIREMRGSHVITKPKQMVNENIFDS